MAPIEEFGEITYRAIFAREYTTNFVWEVDITARDMIPEERIAYEEGKTRCVMRRNKYYANDLNNFEQQYRKSLLEVK